MAELFNITHDADNLNEYDSTVTDGGDLATGTPGLAGTTARMEALIDDTTAIYGTKNVSPPASEELRFRFYVDPNGLTMASGDSFQILRIQLSAAPNELGSIRLEHDGSNYELRGSAYDDNGFVHGADLDISDDVHYAEVYLKKATNSTSNDGEFRWWIDGVEQDYWQDIDNFHAFALLQSLRMGAPSSLDAGTSGTFYLDELKANDDGSEIGAVPAGALPMAMHHYQTRRL